MRSIHKHTVHALFAVAASFGLSAVQCAGDVAETPPGTRDGGAWVDAAQVFQDASGRDATVFAPDAKADAAAPEMDAATRGTFSALSYNVAGLPQGISSGNPVVNMKLISPKLNAFDLVAVQEDFSFHADLVSAMTLPFRSTPKTTLSLGDGLNVFSKFSFTEGARVAWKDCNGIGSAGSDCLTPKGFEPVLLSLGGAPLHVFNMHADAGRGASDQAARRKQVVQLLAAVASTAGTEALLVIGDNNMNASDEDQVQSLLTGAGLTDVCRALSCADPGRIDRIMFRSSAKLALTPKTYTVDTTLFIDGAGGPLSDHEAIAATFDWQR
jgi:hypothetical protein